MRRLLSLPHAKYKSTCYINGLYDILTWKGRKYEYFLLPIVGGMAGFDCLKFKISFGWCEKDIANLKDKY